jgi:hypothetical protein
LSHGGVNRRLFPERAHKIFMDGIKFHPFHMEIDNCLLVYRKNEAKRTGSTFLSQGKQKSRRTGISFRILISPNNHPLPCFKPTEMTSVMLHH